MKHVATWSPMVLCLVAGAARADLEPYSFGASETIEHQSNVLHAEDTGRRADWLSTTEFNAALDQALGRDRLKASGSVNIDRYRELHGRNSEGYTASTEFDWSTVGDISGVLGADSRRRQYLFGLDGDEVSGTRNLQTDNHAFAQIVLGGVGRWSIFTGFDASQRKYSDPTFDVNEQQQWAVSAGTSYQTSPDLSFGVQGRYIRGKYPHVILATGDEMFTLRTLGVNTKWAVSGNSSFDGNVGYTEQLTDGQRAQRYLNGAANWVWAPPSHFKVTLGISRDSNTDAGSAASIINTNNSVAGRSLNTIGHLDVNYELTAKVSLDVLAQYIRRKYSDALLPVENGTDQTDLQSATGASRTSRVSLSAHYMFSRTTNFDCGVSREVHAADRSINLISRPYTDNTVQCVAAIHFD